jgi:hypothetical protein
VLVGNPKEPLRVAIASLIADGAESFIDWVRSDQRFDQPFVLSNTLFEEMRSARCFVDLSTQSNLAEVAEIGPPVSYRPHKLATDYSGGSFGQLGRDFEVERGRLLPQVLLARDYFTHLVEAAVDQICGCIRDGKLRASGTPVQKDREEDRAREMRPCEITESMRLGDNGWLYQGPRKSAPAWKDVVVWWEDFIACDFSRMSDEELDEHIKKLPPSAQRIFEAIRAESKVLGNTRWLDARPMNRNPVIWRRLWELGYENAEMAKNPDSFNRTCRGFFKKHWPSLRSKLDSELAADIPDKNG